jgi:hypothetical protein
MNGMTKPMGKDITRLDKTAGYKLPYVEKTPQEQRAHAEAIGETMNSKPSLFEEIQAAGIPFANHESDLYVPDTEQVRAILARHPVSKSNATTFVNQAPPHKGERWLDIPFAYAPWWGARQTNAKR